MLFPFMIFVTVVIYTRIGFTGFWESKLSNVNMITYAFSEVLPFDHNLPPSDCTQNALRALLLLRRPRYSQQGSRRGLYASPAGINVLCSYSRDLGHLNSHGICTSNLFYPQMSSGNKCSKIVTSKIRLAQLNVRSMNKKAASLYDIIWVGNLTFFVFVRRGITQMTVRI